MLGDLQPEAGVSTETEGNVGGGLSMDIECLGFDEDGSIEIRGDKTQESSLLGVIGAVLEQALHLWQRNGDRTGGVRLSLREESRSHSLQDHRLILESRAAHVKQWSRQRDAQRHRGTTAGVSDGW